MKLNAKSTNGLIVAMLAVAALAVAFWILLLSPKREEAAKLGTEIEQVQGSLAQHRQEAALALEARESFPADYQRLVVLGKAVPGDDDTASFLVQVNRIAGAAGVKFRNLELSAAAGGEAEAPAAPPVAAATGTPVSATEAAASLLPLGATVGPAGLAVMPYTLTFDGSFFEIADFIKGMDSLVETGEQQVSVDGRLVTIDGFQLSAASNAGFPALQATFSVTTYLTPPTQGVTAGATPEAPAPAGATPVASTTGGAP
jgi:Tfp pilus assembly protein PilO